MTAKLMDGNALSRAIKAQIKTDVADFAGQRGYAPVLAALRVGDDDASAGYARAIGKNCRSVGVEFRETALPDGATQAEAEAALRALDADTSVHGIMILEPLPPQIDHDALVLSLDPAKDVDGVHPLNAGRLQQQRPPFFVPATPAGGIRLLEEAGVDFRGSHAVMVGRSDIVGKPMALLLLHRHCTVTLAHSRTQDSPAVCRSADILCVAVGRAEMVKGDWVKPRHGGGLRHQLHRRRAEGRLRSGERSPSRWVAHAGSGGTGPMTNAMLSEQCAGGRETGGSRSESIISSEHRGRQV